MVSVVEMIGTGLVPVWLVSVLVSVEVELVDSAGPGRTELTTEVRIGMMPELVGNSVVLMLVSGVVLLTTSVEVSGDAVVTGAVPSGIVGNEGEADDGVGADDGASDDGKVTGDEELTGNSVVAVEEPRELISGSRVVVLVDEAGGRMPPMTDVTGSRMPPPVVVAAVCCDVSLGVSLRVLEGSVVVEDLEMFVSGVVVSGVVDSRVVVSGVVGLGPFGDCGIVDCEVVDNFGLEADSRMLEGPGVLEDSGLVGGRPVLTVDAEDEEGKMTPLGPTRMPERVVEGRGRTVRVDEVVGWGCGLGLGFGAPVPPGGTTTVWSTMTVVVGVS